MAFVREYKVRLLSVEKVKQFTDIARASNCNVGVISGKFLINGKSIMCLFGIDLLKVLRVEVSGSKMEDIDLLCSKMKGIGVLLEE